MPLRVTSILGNASAALPVGCIYHVYLSATADALNLFGVKKTFRRHGRQNVTQPNYNLPVNGLRNTSKLIDTDHASQYFSNCRARKKSTAVALLLARSEISGLVNLFVSQIRLEPILTLAERVLDHRAYLFSNFIIVDKNSGLYDSRLKISTAPQEN